MRGLARREKRSQGPRLESAHVPTATKQRFPRDLLASCHSPGFVSAGQLDHETDEFIQLFADLAAAAFGADGDDLDLGVEGRAGQLRRSHLWIDVRRPATRIVAPEPATPTLRRGFGQLFFEWHAPLVARPLQQRPYTVSATKLFRSGVHVSQDGGPMDPDVLLAVADGGEDGVVSQRDGADQGCLVWPERQPVLVCRHRGRPACERQIRHDGGPRFLCAYEKRTPHLSAGDFQCEGLVGFMESAHFHGRQAWVEHPRWWWVDAKCVGAIRFFDRHSITSLFVDAVA